MHAIQGNIPSKIIAAMKVKAGPETNFQIDTGATCDVLKLSSIKGTKYANKVTPTNQVLKMYNAGLYVQATWKVQGSIDESQG